MLQVTEQGGERGVLKTEPYQYSPAKLLELYSAMLLPRMIEERMLLLLRQGKISKWFAGIGQEAISVGAAAALRPDELIFTMHRNLGVFTTRRVPLERLLGQLQGKASGFTGGRDRSFHFGLKSYGIVGMISHLGAQLSLAAGAGLSDVLERRGRATLVFTGEGGTSQGEFHEALNLASVWRLPVIFIIENNGYAFSTPAAEQYACQTLSHRAAGYGIKGETIDGNDILAVYSCVESYARLLRDDPQPVLIECMTFRQRGHEETSGMKFVPAELLEQWLKRDPVLNFEQSLLVRGIISNEQAAEIRLKIEGEIERALDLASAAPPVKSTPRRELADVFARQEQAVVFPRSAKRTTRRYLDALSDGLRQALKRHERLIIMGQDIAEYGGAFKVTEGLAAEFGRERVRNTPLCESAVVGAGLGYALNGGKSVIEMQFADFVSCAFNQIVNNLAKIHYRWGQSADVVLRLPTGGGVGAGPYHSQCTEAWFVHTPGLKVVCPAFPYDAKGLLLAAIEDPNPVLFYEHKKLYRSVSQDIPDDYYTLPIGRARVVAQGEDATVITYGVGVHWALDLLKRNPDVSAEVLDLQTLQPLDYEAIERSVRKTGRVLILHEATLTGGVGAELAAHIGSSCFDALDAPVVRCAGMDTPVPFAAQLEENFSAESRFEQQLINLILY